MRHPLRSGLSGYPGPRGPQGNAGPPGAAAPGGGSAILQVVESLYAGNDFNTAAAIATFTEIWHGTITITTGTRVRARVTVGCYSANNANTAYIGLYCVEKTTNIAIQPTGPQSPVGYNGAISITVEGTIGGLTPGTYTVRVYGAGDGAGSGVTVPRGSAPNNGQGCLELEELV